MALTYDGTNGLFTRLGKLFGMMDAVRTHQLDLKTRAEAVLAEYSDADMYMVAPLLANLEARLQQTGAILADLQRACTDTLVETCWADSLVSTRGVLPERTLEQALLYLMREMAADSETVNRTSVTKASVAAGGSNTGTGTLVASELVPLAFSAGGTQYPNVRTERLEVRCVQDAQDGAIRSGEEVFELRGFSAYPNLDYRFPAGSGVRMRMPSVHAGVDSGPRYSNQLRNSGFDAFTSDLPDGWAATTGAASTDFGEETSVVYRGASSLRFDGDGATLTKLRQELGTADGTTGTLVADRLYVLSFVGRSDGSATTGVVRVSLQNAAGTVITGASTTVSYTALATWTRSTVTFRAPLSLPSTVYAVVELTTAVSNGHSMYVDEVVLAEMRQIAPGGEALVVLAGDTDFVVNDNLRLVKTNNAEGDFNVAFDRMFDMYGKGLVLPNSGTPSINDALIS